MKFPHCELSKFVTLYMIALLMILFLHLGSCAPLPFGTNPFYPVGYVALTLLIPLCVVTGINMKITSIAQHHRVKNSVWKFLQFTHIFCNFSIELQTPFLEWHLEVPHNICKLKGPEQGTNKKKSWNILRAKMQLALYHNWWVQSTVWKNENFTLILNILSWNQLAK